MQSPPPLNFFGITDHEKLNDITLTIYAMDPFLTGRVPMSVERLMTGMWVDTIVVSGHHLIKHIDSLNRLYEAARVSVNLDELDVLPRINARMYYIFETSSGEKLLDVAMWSGFDYSVYVNGTWVEWSDIFYDAVQPFLREYMQIVFEAMLGRRPTHDIWAFLENNVGNRESTVYIFD